MFTSARIKLTCWYLVIILAVSTSFSLFVYRQITSEVRRSLRLHTLRLIPGSQLGFPFSPNGQQFYIAQNDNSGSIEQEIYEELRKRIILELLLINAGIASLSMVAGYFLAGKTLRPIEQMVEDQKRFVADASHELRTPLTSMKTEIEVALIEKEISSTDAKTLLRSNLEEIDRMQLLANYLLNLNKYQDKTLKLPFEKLDLKDIVEKTIVQLESASKKKKLTITQKLKSVRLNGNAMSLGELVTILLDNAIKYSSTDGEIIVRTKILQKHAILEVEDFGIGIKPDDVPYIFNRFYRADTSRTKNQIDGYGLGLSIAKQVAEIHHGHISVESQPDQGSLFRVTLPL